MTTAVFQRPDWPVIPQAQGLLPLVPAASWGRKRHWKDSHFSDRARFPKIARAKAQDLYRRVKRWNAAKIPGRYGGRVGSSALRVVEALIFDFLNYRTGRLDPSYEAIARKTGLSRATVATALKQLRSLGVLAWVRRVEVVKDDAGLAVIVQDTNLYSLADCAGWTGYVDDDAARLPLAASEWGAAPVMPSIIEQACTEQKGGGVAAMLRTLRTDPADTLALALARLGESIQGRKTADLSEV